MFQVLEQIGPFLSIGTRPFALGSSCGHHVVHTASKETLNLLLALLPQQRSLLAARELGNAFRMRVRELKDCFYVKVCLMIWEMAKLSHFFRSVWQALEDLTMLQRAFGAAETDNIPITRAIPPGSASVDSNNSNPISPV
jgi:hypothetical protein